MLDWAKSFYARVAAYHFVGKRISGLIGIESAMDFKAFGNKHWEPGRIWVCAGSGDAQPFGIHGEKGQGIDGGFAEYHFLGAGIFDIKAADIFSGAFCHSEPSELSGSPEYSPHDSMRNIGIRSGNGRAVY